MPHILCQKCNKISLISDGYLTEYGSICMKCYDKEHKTIDKIIEEKYHYMEMFINQSEVMNQLLETNAILRYLEEENIKLREEIDLLKGKPKK